MLFHNTITSATSLKYASTSVYKLNFNRKKTKNGTERNPMSPFHSIYGRSTNARSVFYHIITMRSRTLASLKLLSFY